MGRKFAVTAQTIGDGQRNVQEMTSGLLDVLSQRFPEQELYEQL